MDRRSLLAGLALTAACGVPKGADSRVQLRYIESFGALGDGRGDDTDAFMRAIDWERATPGRQYVALCAGSVYRVTRTLQFDFPHGGLVCLAGAAVINFDMTEGNGIEVHDAASRSAYVSGSWFRGVHVVSETARDGHGWYYRRARFGHINEDCGASGRWNHAFHYDNGCYGNNMLSRPHLELAGQTRIGIWIGPVCHGLHVLHPEINNPSAVGIEVDASQRSDTDEGPGVNSVVLDHVMTHGCGEAHIRVNGALGLSIRSPRLEAGDSTAALTVLGDRAGCEGVVIETPWFQGSDHARAAVRIGRVQGMAVICPQVRRIAGPVFDFEKSSVQGLTIVHPSVRDSGPLIRGDAAGTVLLDTRGDLTLHDPACGLVLRDRADGKLRRLGLRDGRLITEPAAL